MIKSKKTIIRIAVLALVVLVYHNFSPYKLQFLGHYGKIWAHRANSIEKQQSALNFYDGIELDLIYISETNILDVNHAREESINLSFEDYLKALNGKTPYLWLDVDNLKAENAKQIFSKLELLLKKTNFPKSKLLVESRFPYALPIFVKNGYNSSYYVTSKLRCMKGITKENEIKKIDSVLKSQPKLAISSDCSDYEVLSANFPSKKKYFWALESDFNRRFFANRTMLNDTSVVAVLANYNALSGNR